VPAADGEGDGVAAALAAFDSLELPSRNRDEQHYAAGYREDAAEAESASTSPLAPEQLRARLRAFQSEFREGQQTADPYSSRPSEGDPR